MNGRFVQLAYEAKLFNGMPAPVKEVEKFAELIVRECASKAWFAEQYGIGDGAPVSKQIKEHFGVEE